MGHQSDNTGFGVSRCIGAGLDRMACSNSLRSLHLDVTNYFPRMFTYEVHRHGLWIDDDWEFPFALSAHKYLKKLSIFAMVYATDIEIFRGLPVIVRLIKQDRPFKLLSSASIGMLGISAL